jgi:hypothetical protein
MSFADTTRDQGEKDKTQSTSSRMNSPIALWPAALAFLILSSILFAWLFEWDRYQVITAYRLHSLSLLDQVLLFWLLVAKSLGWFVPWLLMAAVLIALGLTRIALLVLNCFWIGIFYFMAVDLVAVNYTAYHAWEYWLPMREILAHPQHQLTRWLTEELTAETLVVFGVFAISGPLCFVFCRQAAMRLGRVFPRLRSPQAAALMVVLFAFAIGGVVPALFLFSDQAVLDRTFASLPFPTEVREALRASVEKSVGRGAQVRVASSPDLSGAIGHPGAKQEDRRGIRRSSGDLARVRPADELLAIRHVREAVDPGPADFSAFVNKANLPNVIIIFFESFRHSAIAPELMRELDEWSHQGLRLERHYSGSNCSHLGLFSLFYGRSPLGYYQNLDRDIPPQLLESLRRSGYRITYLTSGETKGFRGLDRFLNDTYCDQILVEGEFNLKEMNEWPDSDRRKLARLQSIVSAPRDQPQCVFFYLLSSHWQYSYPPQFEIYKEAARFRQFFNPWEQIQSHLNRYANSLLFLDHELMKVLGSIDLKQNIVVITGDHGESMGEDGVFRHGTRMSEIQMRTPCVMVGAGIEPRKITTATAHYDILPTLLHALAQKTVPIENCQGRDLIADPSPADEVGLAPANGPLWEGLLIIRAKKRMAFITDIFGGVPSFEFAGLVDQAGQYESKVGRADRVRHVLRMKR